MDFLSYFILIVLTFLVLWISHRYLNAPENPWKKAGITVVSRWDSLIYLIKYFTLPLHLQLRQSHEKYGKLYGSSSVFGSLAISVAEPELIRSILVKDFQYFVNRLENVNSGDPVVDSMMSVANFENWKRIRNITSQTFSTGKIRKMTSVIFDCVETLEKNFKKDAAQKSPSDIKKLVSAFTMDAMASTAFSTKIDSHNDPDNHFYKAAAKIFDRWGQVKNIIFVAINNALVKLKLKPIRIRFFKLFENLAKDMIEERKRSGQIKNDFLQLMLDSSSDEGSVHDASETNTSKEKDTSKNDQKRDDTITTRKESKRLNDMEIIGQSMLFLIGGLETVSSAISFALYELAINEDIQEKLISEIDQILLMNQKQLTYENVQTMKYLDNIVSETLRKYPPGLFVLRIATRDYKVTDTNLVIPKGTSVIIPVYALHYDPDYFPNPDTFDPTRFTAEKKAARNSYVYLPFGAGPRNCVAMRFALIELKLCLAHLLSRFRFHKCSKTQVPLKFPIGQPQLIANNIFLIAEEREDVLK